jgi:hypothetical protein
MSGQHSELAPSSAATRMQCAGSRHLEQLVPNMATPQSIEGELAHAVLAAMLREEELPPGATEEMLDGAELFVDNLLSRGIPETSWRIEERLDISMVHPQCWGTPDLWAVCNKTFFIDDYKFGHVYVDPFENWQLMHYALGALAATNCLEGYDDWPVVLTIVQPRCFVGSSPVRSWALTVGQLKAYLPRMQAAALAAMQPLAPTQTGSECRFCAAASICPTLQQAAHIAVHIAGGSFHSPLSASSLGGELTLLQRAQEILRARIDGLEEEGLQRARQGANIPGWRVEQKVGRQQWVRPVAEVLALGEMLGVDVSKPGALTPKQAIKAGLPEEVVGAYSDSPRGAMQLVADDLTKARAIFTGA